VKGGITMFPEFNQVELTDQELKQVTGGAGIAGANVATGTLIGTNGGVLTAGQSTGLAAGTTGGLATAGGSSTALQSTTPTGTISGGVSSGQAGGLGF
jgi:bacteriocin-like protein